MGIQQSFLSNFRNIHVTKLGSAVFMQEDIRTFQVPVEYLNVMQRFEASDHLNEYFPDIVFLYVLLVLLMISNFLEKITVIRIFHHYT